MSEAMRTREAENVKEAARLVASKSEEYFNKKVGQRTLEGYWRERPKISN
jgi:hypothetical protein